MSQSIALTHLFQDVSGLIESARREAARYVNASLVMLYWQIGQRVHREVLDGERGEYGEGVVKQLAKQLTRSYGRGFNSRALFRMVRFAKLYPNQEIVATLSPLFPGLIFGN